MLLLLAKSLVYGMLNPVYWFAIGVTYRRYQRENCPRPGQMTVRSVGAGLWSGTLGVLLVSGLGLSVQMGMYLALLFPTALILAKIRPRFCCFAYSGAVLGLLGIGDVPGILAVVGLLHVMEAALSVSGVTLGSQLVWKDERLRSVPMRQGCWPVPFALLIPGSTAAEVLQMPSWWPLLGEGTYFSLFPMTALILYQAEGHERGWRLLGYGVLLLGVSLLLPQGKLWEILGLFIMVYIHEWILLE